MRPPFPSLVLTGFFSVLLFAPILLAEEYPALFLPVDGTQSRFQSRAFASSGTDEIEAKIDLSVLERAGEYGDKLRVLLPDRDEVIVRERFQSRGRQSFTWFGAVEGFELSSVVISAAKGIVFANLSLDGETYLIRPLENHYSVVKRDPSSALPIGDDVSIPDPASLLLSSPSENKAGAFAAREDGSVIEILVLYTSAMSEKQGHDLEALIQHFVDLANDAFARSGINTSLRLVHAEHYNDPSAKEGIDNGRALQHITDDNDVAELRQTYNADLVSLLRVYPGYQSSCGRAWMMTPTTLGQQFSQYAFSVVEVLTENDPSSLYYCPDRTFAHEVGHNLGCSHDRNHASGQGAYSYSYGYDVRNVFATIMSYDSPRVNYFSTPLKTYSGFPLGIPAGRVLSADNALTINQTRDIVANFEVSRVRAEFTAKPTTGGTPLRVDFSDQSTGSVLSWSWSFGDGRTSEAKNPSHTYREPGIYTVSLTVLGSADQDSETKVGLIEARAGTADLTPWLMLLLGE